VSAFLGSVLGSGTGGPKALAVVVVRDGPSIGAEMRGGDLSGDFVPRLRKL